MIGPEREQFLQRLALFSDLEAGQLGALAEVAQVVQFPASTLIFREGEAGDCAYVVVRGSVEVFAIDRNGDEIVLAGKDAQNVALALHELATNAAKYGALRIPEGKISVSWSVEQTASGKLLKVGWQERGGPPTTVPRRKGFGTALLTSIFSEASLDYAPDGLSCQFSVSIAPPLAVHFDEARLPGF